MSLIRLAPAFAIALLLGWTVVCCGAHTNRVHVDETGGVEDTGIDSQDLRTVAQKMARSIIQLHPIAQAKSSPRIAFLEVQNNSNDMLDTDWCFALIRMTRTA